ncbi:hypothetical protein BSKO_05313 [Bryopsis sp. KO-2023]|nr:hypothetical protein BSKO_05313 [Bryopsis sp. KO-2023]
MVVRGRSLGELMKMSCEIRRSKPPDAAEQQQDELASRFVELLSEGSQAVMDEFNSIVDFITASTEEYDVETCVRFFSVVLATIVASEDESVVAFGNEVLKGVAARTMSSSKSVRMCSCHLLVCFLEQFPSDAELDMDMADEIQQAFLARLTDKESGIRSEAAKGVHRFQGGGDEDDAVKESLMNLARSDGSAKARAAALNSLPVDDETLEVILERASDTSEVVQVMALNILHRKLDAGRLDGKQMVTTASKGLTDASEFVRTVAERMVRFWLEGWANGDPVRFVTMLDPAESEEKSEEVVTYLLAKKFITLEALCSSCGVGDTVWQGRSLDKNWVFLLRVACVWLHGECKKAPNPSDVAEQTENQATVETLDRVLPAVEHLVSSIRHHIGSGERFQVRQFVALMAGACDLNDAFQRQEVASLVKELLTIDGGKEWLSTSVSLGRVVWPDAKSFVDNALQVVEDVCTRQGGNSLHACRLVAEVFRCIGAKMAVPSRHQNLMAKLLEHLMGLVHSQEEGVPPELVATALEALPMHCLVFGIDQQVVRAVHSGWMRDEPEIQEAGFKGLMDIAQRFGIRTVTEALENSGGFIESVLERGIGLEDRDEDEGFSSMEVTAIKCLCRLVYFNDKWKQKGMDKATELRCLVRLVVVMCHPCTDIAPEVDQILEVFFEEFATSSASKQHDLQLAFLPAVYECLELPGPRRGPACQAVNLLSDLLFAPVRSPNGKSKRVTSGHIQLGCLLLWELVHCTDEFGVRAYTSMLWKAISNLEFDEAPRREVKVLASLVEHWALEGDLSRQRAEVLREKLGDTVVEPLGEEKVEEVLDMLREYFEKLSEEGFDGLDFDITRVLGSSESEASELSGGGDGEGQNDDQEVMD